MILTKMDHNEKCITFIWKIKNISLCVLDMSTILCPFFVPEMGGVYWYIQFSPKSWNFVNGATCGILAHENEHFHKQFEFDYELSILASDGSVQQSERFLGKAYKDGYIDRSSLMYIKKDKLLSKSGMWISDDSLTIRCRMWHRQNLISLSGVYFAETLLNGHTKFIEGKIENFSNLKPRETFPLIIFSDLRKTVFSSFNLCIAADGHLAIEMEFNDHSIYIYKIFVRDIFGNEVKCGEGEIFLSNDSNQHRAPLNLSKEHFIKNKRYFLPDDILTMRCEVKYLAGGVRNPIKTEYGFAYQKKPVENLTLLKDDLTSLFKEGILCDTTLKTDTETFPAHTVVLSARSPVFKSMFTTDIKEKTNNCVNIDDLDADTVRRMLLFMYSGNLDDLEYESAKSLYFAADKYKIASLFLTCSNFLKRNLLPSNCCDLLLLSDIHQDKNLKAAVVDFMAGYDEAVLVSNEWKNLEKNNPLLAIEVRSTVCMKNQRI